MYKLKKYAYYLNFTQRIQGKNYRLLFIACTTYTQTKKKVNRRKGKNEKNRQRKTFTVYVRRAACSDVRIQPILTFSILFFLPHIYTSSCCASAHTHRAKREKIFSIAFFRVESFVDPIYARVQRTVRYTLEKSIHVALLL